MSSTTISMPRPVRPTEAVRGAIRLVRSQAHCLVRGHDWLIDVSPYRDRDECKCARCGQRREIA